MTNGNMTKKQIIDFAENLYPEHIYEMSRLRNHLNKIKQDNEGEDITEEINEYHKKIEIIRNNSKEKLHQLTVMCKCLKLQKGIAEYFKVANCLLKQCHISMDFDDAYFYDILDF